MSTCTGISIRNLMLPTDFSDESAQAIRYVCALQHHYNATVYVVHVLDLFPFSLSSEASAAARIDELRQAGNTQMQEFVQKYGLRGNKFESMLLAGEVSSAVDQFTREHEIDLIVLGTRGAAGINRVFQGSMTEEIFRDSRCPVMVIGPNAGQTEAGGVFNHLFFPTDLSTFSRAALPYVEFLLSQNPAARVSLAHFLEKEPRGPYARHNARRQAEQELRAMICPALRPQIQDVIVEFCSPTDGIVEMTRGLNADLLVLGVRHGGSFVRAATHGLCSIAHQVTAEAPCPVLTVRGV